MRSGLILNNNEMILIPFNDIRDRHLLLNYFTSYEIVKKSIWSSRGIKMVNAKEPRKLYEIVYGEDNLPKYYLIPRGLQTFIPDDVMKQILIEQTDTHSLVDPIFTDDDIRTSLQPMSGFDLRPDQVMVITKMLKLKRGICQVATGCFSGDTKVRLLNGTVETFENLYKSGVSEVDVFSCTDDGDIVRGKGTDIRITKYVTELVDVELDDGSVTRCTPEHPWMMRDGSYKKAETLLEGESLMPLYLGHGRGFHTHYHCLSNPKDGSWQAVHRKMVEGEVPKGYHVHHKNENKLDNRPSNLEVLSHSEHCRDHLSVYNQDSELQRTRAINYSKTPEAKAKNREIMTNYNKSDKGRAESKNRAQHMRDLKANMKENNPEKYELVKLKQKVGAVKANCKRHHSNHPMDCDKCRDKYKLAVDNVRLLDSSYPGYNHKVVKVTKVTLDGAIPVYDMTVDKYHNFAIETSDMSGVFVHNSGKTECMSSFIKILTAFNPNIKILVIEPTDILTKKTSDRFNRYNLDSVTYKESRGSISHTVTVSHVASLMRDLTENPNLLSEVTVVLQDEAQHLQADTWLAINKATSNAEYSIGMSALAIDERNIHCTDISKLSYEEALIVGATGRVIAHIPPEYFIENGILATPTVFQVLNKINPKYSNCNDWHELRKECICSESRSKLTADVTKIFHEHGRRSLILVGVKQQAYDIYDQLRAVGINDVCILFGGDKSMVYDDVKKKYVAMKVNAVDEFDEGRRSVLISTSVMDEGVDVDKLDVVILASGGKSDRRIIQRVGRALRKTKTGKYAYVIDFLDEGAGVLTHHSIQRMRVFKELISAPVDLIFEKIKLNNLESKFKELEGIEEPCLIRETSEIVDQLSFLERLY